MSTWRVRIGGPWGWGGALLLAAAVVGCAQHPTAPQPDGARVQTASTHPRPVLQAGPPEGLPRIRFDGHRWVPPKGHRGLGDLVGRDVVIRGKMLLDSPAPERTTFGLVPYFPGCVPSDGGLARHAIRVRLVSGTTVPVTDRPVWVWGRLLLDPDRRAGRPRLRLEARGVVVERRPRAPRGSARR